MSYQSTGLNIIIVKTFFEHKYIIIREFPDKFYEPYKI